MESNVIDIWNDIMYHNIKQHYSPNTLEMTSTCLPWIPLVLSDQLVHPSSVLTFNSSLNIFRTIVDRKVSYSVLVLTGNWSFYYSSFIMCVPLSKWIPHFLVFHASLKTDKICLHGKQINVKTISKKEAIFNFL